MEKIIDESKQGSALVLNERQENQKKLFIESYGCQMNFSDSEIVAAILNENGFGATRNYEEADLVLFVVDGREGPSSLDDDILQWLRKTARPTLLVVNKTDGIDARAAAEFLPAIEAMMVRGINAQMAAERG